MAFHLVTGGMDHQYCRRQIIPKVSIPLMAFHLVTSQTNTAAVNWSSLNSLDGLSSRGRLVASGRMGQANRFCLNSLDGLSSRDQLSLASFGKDLASLNSLDGFSSRDIDRFLETFTLRKSQFPRWPFIS